MRRKEMSHSKNKGPEKSIGRGTCLNAIDEIIHFLSISLPQIDHPSAKHVMPAFSLCIIKKLLTNFA
jgi:hypothetical protein